ncbi:hypothetical protein V8G54_037506 [Vigna mungo]|uniref:Uncharacterized protein n=1 Tax=Vigna mungo TaxID=3915 RepID=A0AAQ3RGJ9_VIGMU
METGLGRPVVETGLKGQYKNWAYGLGELGLWANMEIGLGGPVWKLGLRTSLKTGLMGQYGNWVWWATGFMGQYGNWAWWANVETALKGQCKNWAYGPGELGLWANMEIGLLKFAICQMRLGF